MSSMSAGFKEGLSHFTSFAGLGRGHRFQSSSKNTCINSLRRVRSLWLWDVVVNSRIRWIVTSVMSDHGRWILLGIPS